MRAAGAWRARWWLRECTRAGARVSLRGRPLVSNRGSLEIGDDFALASTPVQSHLVAGPGAALRIGNRVRIAYGAAVACLERIDIEDDVTIGAFSMLLDSDFHVAGDSAAAPEPRPIRIGTGACLGHRVIVMPGATVGPGATVRSGSVVAGDVAPGAVVSGNPARSVLEDRSPDSTDRASVASGGDPVAAVREVVRQVMRLPAPPALASGPGDVPGWDSLGALQLILALEETFAVALTEDDIRSARTVGELAERVKNARDRSTASAH